jgi:hypothetical protein
MNNRKRALTVLRDKPNLENLPCLSRGEGQGYDLNGDGSCNVHPVPASLAGAAQLRVTVNFSCCKNVAFVLDYPSPRMASQVSSL